MIEDGVSGFVFRAQDCHDLAQKMRQFIEKEELVVSMGDAAAERVRVINNEEKYYNTLMDIYHDAIERNRNAR